jgi:quercetin dioxygenase-like cupin family protein
VAYTIVDIDKVEKKHGIWKQLGPQLGVGAFGISQIELPPDASGPEHDHADDGQEEVYVPIRGRGKVRVDGEDVELHPGVVVFVTPESTRQLSAGDEGLVFVAVGARRARPGLRRA